MIQDIFPHKFINHYDPSRKAEKDSIVLCFSGRKVLLSEECFPLVSDLPSVDPEKLIYLFSVDEDKNYFLCTEDLTELPVGFAFEEVRGLREKDWQHRYRLFVAYTGLQLAEWYRANRFCGKCGAQTHLDDTERAIRCDSCGRVIYPRIVPAVIVGVLKDDKMLVTKYARGYAHYALVAGFTEIGETLEETVAREVLEETGLTVKNIRYYKSQPWGIVDDLLAGFFCEAVDDEIKMDDTELAVAKWVSREEMVPQPQNDSLTSEMMRMFQEGKVSAKTLSEQTVWPSIGDSDNDRNGSDESSGSAITREPFDAFYMWQVVNQTRESFKASDDARDAGLTFPENVERMTNIAYGPDDKWQLLDLYWPKYCEESPLPVIISVHGGGWVYGTKETYQYYCTDLAKRGFAVVNFTYRLAPEFQYPSSLEDVNLVCEWVLKNAECFGLDPNNIFGVGDSAGAHLLALHAGFCTNEENAKKYPFAKPEGFSWKGLGLNCGVYRIKIDRNDPGRAFGMMQALMPNHGTDEELEMINAEKAVTEHFPPVFLMTADGDFLQQDALDFAAALMKKSVPFSFNFYHGTKGKLGHVFHCDQRLPEAELCNDQECAFFMEQMDHEKIQ